MTQPREDHSEHVAPEHDREDGPAMGWSARDFSTEDYVGDEETDGFPLLYDGTQTEGADGAQ
jgi:hypothetical protein